MNRREFVKFVALTALGTAAAPEQLAALERYFEVNTPRVETGLVMIDELLVSGTASHSMVADITLGTGMDYGLRLGLNLFGGIVRWAAAPKQEIVAQAKDVLLTITCKEPAQFVGQLMYVDQDAKRHVLDLDSSRMSPTYRGLGEAKTTSICYEGRLV